MSNYMPHCRSNHFRVTNPAAFLIWAENLDLTVNVQHQALDDENPVELAMIHPNERTTEGHWPSDYYEDDEGVEHDRDWMLELSTHLADNEVAVLMEAGHEKLRYVCGYAVAIRNNGDMIVVSLNDIYEKAKAEWPEANTITDCSY